MLKPTEPLHCLMQTEIFETVLSNRLKIAMSILIGSHKTCGLERRSMQTNIHIARAVLEHCSSSHDRLTMLEVGSAKAFDRVGHSFVFPPRA